MHARPVKEAVTAYRDALMELSREQVPLQASALGNLGVALMYLADPTKDAAMTETAFPQIETALENHACKRGRTVG